jgi:hypothetical protein
MEVSIHEDQEDLLEMEVEEEEDVDVEDEAGIL